MTFLSSEPVDTQALAAALDASSLDAMRRHEIAISREGRAREVMRLGVDNWSGDPNELKVRRGAVGGFRDECPLLERLESYPFTQATLAAPLDPIASSDTHWTVGASGGDSALQAPLVARQRHMSAKIVELEAKIGQLRALIRGRDAIIGKLKARLAGASEQS